MRSSPLFLICVLVAAVWATGCSSVPAPGGEGINPAPYPQQSPQQPSQQLSPVPTMQSPSPAGETPEVTQTVSPTETQGVLPSREEISRHLMDIAFGDTNDRIVNIYRWSDRLWIAIDGKYTDGDIDALMDETKTLNDIVQGFTISDDRRDINFRTDENARIKFYLLPSKDLEEVLKPWKYSVNLYQSVRNPADGSLSMFVVGNSVYVSSDLPTESRLYYLKRGLLIALGFPGRTDRYNDSFFASNRMTDTPLTTIDREAISLLYAGKIRNGMKPDEVRELLMLPKRE